MSVGRLERLRDRLLSQGRPSIVPRPLGQGPGELSSYGRLRPFAEVVFLVIASDGSVEEAERATLRGALRVLTGDALGTAAADKMIGEFAEALQHEGLELRLDRVASELYGDREDVELALSLALAAGLSDGALSEGEEEIVLALAERLGVSPARLRALEIDPS